MRWHTLEAVLFAHGSPMERSDLARILGIAEWELSELLHEYEHALEGRAFLLRHVGSSVLLEVRPEHQEILLRAAGERRAGLSGAAYETLAIVAYRQPVTRLEIEEIRGVRADRSLATLVEEGLIEEAGRAPGPGQPRLYRTTVEFLRRFSLTMLADLPPSPLSRAESGGTDEATAP